MSEFECVEFYTSNYLRVFTGRCYHITSHQQTQEEKNSSECEVLLVSNSTAKMDFL